MNPIDIERTCVGFVRQNHSPADITINKHNSHEVLRRSSDTQLAGLVVLVKDTPEIINHNEVVIQNEKINLLKVEVNTNTYVVDYDGLVENIMASDYEL